MIIDPSAMSALDQALGHAITRWQHIETSLYVIAHCCMRTDHRITSIVFFQIRSPEKKAQLVDRLCFEVFGQTEYDAHWKPLRKEISEHSAVRNAMAHFEVVAIRADDTKTAYPLAITPHHLDMSAIKGETVSALYVEQLVQVAEEYKATAARLMHFVVEHMPDWRERAESLPPHLQRTLRLYDKTDSQPEPSPPFSPDLG